MMNEDQESEMQ